eukprot:248957-Pyramimonas_sp.AAC.1
MERRNLSDLLKSMDVSHIMIQFGYCKFLEGLDQQIRKACIQDLLDYSARTIIPGQASTRVFMIPGVQLENATAILLHQLLHDVYKSTALDVEIWPQEIHLYDNPPPQEAKASKDRLIFYGFSDGSVRVEFLGDWLSCSTESLKKIPHDDVHYLVQLLGDLQPEGHRQYSRRR